MAVVAVGLIAPVLKIMLDDIGKNQELALKTRFYKDQLTLAYQKMGLDFVSYMSNVKLHQDSLKLEGQKLLLSHLEQSNKAW